MKFYHPIKKFTTKFQMNPETQIIFSPVSKIKPAKAPIAALKTF